MFVCDALGVHKGNTLIVTFVCYLHPNGAHQFVGILLSTSFVYSGHQFPPPFV